MFRQRIYQQDQEKIKWLKEIEHLKQSLNQMKMAKNQYKKTKEEQNLKRLIDEIRSMEEGIKEREKRLKFIRETKKCSMTKEQMEDEKVKEGES